MLHVHDAAGQVAGDFDGFVAAEVVEGHSLLLPGERVVEVGVDVVDVCADEVHSSRVDEVAVHYRLLVYILNRAFATQRLTFPLASPLMTSELLQKTEVMVSP